VLYCFLGEKKDNFYLHFKDRKKKKVHRKKNTRMGFIIRSYLDYTGLVQQVIVEISEDEKMRELLRVTDANNVLRTSTLRYHYITLYIILY
jgi:hypothetical protein